jgi:hypothetical protein
MRWAIAVAITALSIASSSQAQGRLADVPPPPAAVAAITLPSGRLQPLTQAKHAVFFIDLDRSVRRGSSAEVWNYTVYEPGVLLAPGKTANQVIEKAVIDCVKRQITVLGYQAYDGAGKLVLWSEAESTEAVQPNTAQDLQRKVVCEHEQPPLSPLVGRAAAMALAFERLRAAQLPAAAGTFR